MKKQKKNWPQAMGDEPEILGGHRPRRSITIRFSRSRSSQARVAVLFAALQGKPAPELCNVCGGVDSEDGPLAGRCVCTKVAPRAA